MTVPNKNREVDSFEYRDVKFRIGIHKNTWVKNVVALGLAAGFIEPLESNGLYTTHEFLIKLVRSLYRGKISQTDIDMYNATTKNMFDTFATFVSMHYSLSHRQDTKYWQDISNRKFDPEMQEFNLKYPKGYLNLVENIFTTYTTPTDSGLGCIATGLNHLVIDNVAADLFIMHDKSILQKIKDTLEIWENVHKEWELEADESLTVYEYLKKNVYEE
jgi:tryptophan halogenase